MKKLTLSVALLRGSISAKSQAVEYIDVTSKKLFGKSEMTVYNDIVGYNDLEYLYLGRFNSNYHWVSYTNAGKIILSMNDNPGDLRRVCTKQGVDSTKCKVYDAFATQYIFNAKQEDFQIWISKPKTSFE